MKMAKDENRGSIWAGWVLETLDQQSGSPTVLLYTVKEEVGDPDQLTLGHPHSHNYQFHSHPHHHCCRHHHNHWLGNMMTAVTVGCSHLDELDGDGGLAHPSSADHHDLVLVLVHPLHHDHVNEQLNHPPSAASAA